MISEHTEVILRALIVLRVNNCHALKWVSIGRLRVESTHTEGKYPGQTQFTRTPNCRLANSVASIFDKLIVAALLAL